MSRLFNVKARPQRHKSQSSTSLGNVENNFQ